MNYFPLNNPPLLQRNTHDFLTHTPLPALTFLLTLLLLQFCAGCTVVQIVDILGPDGQMLREGEKQYAKGNYQEAATLFEEVLSSDTGIQTHNAALYNLACAKIALAENDLQFVNAITELKTWQKSFEAGLYIENPELIITALDKRLEILHKEKATTTALVQKNRIQITSQHDKISQLKSRLKILQHQISELEAIDHQIQKKKKPL